MLSANEVDKHKWSQSSLKEWTEFQIAVKLAQLLLACLRLLCQYHNNIYISRADLIMQCWICFLTKWCRWLHSYSQPEHLFVQVGLHIKVLGIINEYKTLIRKY